MRQPFVRHLPYVTCATCKSTLRCLVLALTFVVSVTGCSTSSPHGGAARASKETGAAALMAVIQAPFASSAAWHKLPTMPYPGKQDDIYFVTTQRGWYGNGAGKLYRTDDGGATWQALWNQPGTFIRTLAFVDAQRGFVGNVGTDYYPGVTDTQPLYETRDGGQTWLPVPASRIDGPAVKGLCAIDIVREQRIFQGELREHVIIHAAGRVGGPGFIMRSVDGGEQWRVIDMRKHVGPILDIKFFSAQVGLVFAGTDADVAKSNALILLTQDGGETWREVYRSTRPYELTWKASFPTREVGYVTIQSYNPDRNVSQRVVAKTMDGGNTWREIPLVDDFAVRQFGVAFIDAQIGWVGTSTTGFETRDGGASWSRVEMGRAVNKIRVVRGARESVAYAIGVDVYKFAAPRRD